MKLIAKKAILYLAHQYRAGDTLPVNNAEMIELWINAGSAAWVDDADQADAPKARLVTAEPGTPGIRDGGAEGDLVGNIPKEPGREKPRRSRRKTT